MVKENKPKIDIEFHSLGWECAREAIDISFTLHIHNNGCHSYRWGSINARRHYLVARLVQEFKLDKIVAPAMERHAERSLEEIAKMVLAKTYDQLMNGLASYFIPFADLRSADDINKW